MKYRLLSLLATLVVIFPVLLSASCAPAQNSQAQLHMGHESSLSKTIATAPARTRDAYRFAMANPDALKNVPCYCGCGPLGHKNNYDCYIKGANADGSFDFDNHALGCEICVDITQDAMRYIKAGKPAVDIRTAIDRTYSARGPSNMP
ncbi:MAG: hypothetical protein HZB53_08245 [Chloroflexi bacterium]|nr:hypothetical protein [Chloroflexota bacterium]